MIIKYYLYNSDYEVIGPFYEDYMEPFYPEDLAYDYEDRYRLKDYEILEEYDKEYWDNIIAKVIHQITYKIRRIDMMKRELEKEEKELDELRKREFDFFFQRDLRNK
jgi:hypothetical protein